MAIEEATVEAFNAAVKNVANGRIKIDVHESKNAAEIRKTDTAIRSIDQQLKDAEKLRPKLCDCSCGLTADSSKRMEKAPVADYMPQP